PTLQTGGRALLWSPRDLANCELQKILLRVNQSHPELVQPGFGAQPVKLLKLITETQKFHKPWADEPTLPSRALAEPRRSMFARFGSFPQVNEQQVKHVH